MQLLIWFAFITHAHMHKDVIRQTNSSGEVTIVKLIPIGLMFFVSRHAQRYAEIFKMCITARPSKSFCFYSYYTIL